MGEFFRVYGFSSPKDVATRDFILLNSSDSKSNPIFFFHDMLGNGKQFVTLAQKWSSPFYGVELSESAPLSSLESLAAHYVGAIQWLQQTGPYQLGGFSFGALLATEIARQLEAKQHTVSCVIAVDPPPYRLLHNRDAATKASNNLLAVESGLPYLLDSLSGPLFDCIAELANSKTVALDSCAAQIVSLLLETPAYKESSVEDIVRVYSSARMMVAVWRGLYERYVPVCKIEAPVTLVRIPPARRRDFVCKAVASVAKGEQASEGEDLDLVANGIAQRVVDIFYVDCAHSDVFQRQHAVVVASLLEKLTK